MHKAPCFIEKLQNTSVAEGHPVRLECRVSGVPFPQIFWKKENESFTHNTDRIRYYSRPWANQSPPTAIPNYSLAKALLLFYSILYFIALNTIYFVDAFKNSLCTTSLYMAAVRRLVFKVPKCVYTEKKDPCKRNIHTQSPHHRRYRLRHLRETRAVTHKL